MPPAAAVPHTSLLQKISDTCDDAASILRLVGFWGGLVFFSEEILVDSLHKHLSARFQRTPFSESEKRKAQKLLGP